MTRFSTKDNCLWFSKGMNSLFLQKNWYLFHNSLCKPMSWWRCLCVLAFCGILPGTFNNGKTHKLTYYWWKHYPQSITFLLFLVLRICSSIFALTVSRKGGIQTHFCLFLVKQGSGAQLILAYDNLMGEKVEYRKVSSIIGIFLRSGDAHGRPSN